MKLYCPKCATVLPSKQINIQNMVAQCDICHKIFNFADQVEPQAKGKAALIPQPRRLTYKNDGDSLEISWRWANSTLVFLIIFTLFWNGIVFGGFGGIFAEDNSGPGLFMLPHTLIGLYMIFYCLLSLVNKTKIKVDLHRIQVRHGPIPWFGNKRFDRDEILQFYSKQSAKKSNKGKITINNELHVILRKGTQVRLLGGLPSSEYPIFIEDALESFWGIEDTSVKGEFQFQ